MPSTSTTAELRAQVLEAYGAACDLCSEDDVDLLQIDHRHGGGSQERKKIRGYRFYAKVIKDGFPDAYRLLCVACHRKVTLGQPATPHLDIPAPIRPAVTPRDPDPPAQECQEVATILRRVTDRLEAIEDRLPPVAWEDHRALPAVVTPTNVVFEAPLLNEAWRLQQAALQAAHHEIATAQREVFERWMSRAVMVASMLVIGAGAFGVFLLGQWVFAAS
jgi:hypothetical protein